MEDDAESPDALSRLEDTWLDIVRTFTGKFRWVFPYWPNTVDALAQYALYVLLALPVLAVALGVAGLSVGVTEFIASVTASGAALVGGLRLAMTNVEVAGAIVAVLYLSSVFKYHPIDKNDYQGQSTPTDYEAWESMLTVMTFGVLPTAYFSLLYFEEASIVMELTGLSAYVLSWLALILAYIPFYKWMHHRYGAGRNVAPQMATVQGYTGFYLLGIGTYMSLIAFGVDILVYGSGVGAVFAVHLAWMVFTARRLRWAVYTDWAGYGLHPNIPLWGLVARGPLVFAVYAVVVGEGMSMAVVVASFSPLAAAVGYIAWRAYVTGDLKEPANGWMSSPGRKQYRKVRKSNEKRMEKTEEVRKAVVQFNRFAANHSISTLPEPENFMNANAEEVREELKVIHQYEARDLSGEAFKEYMNLRDDLRDVL